MSARPWPPSFRRRCSATSSTRPATGTIRSTARSDYWRSGWPRRCSCAPTIPSPPRILARALQPPPLEVGEDFGRGIVSRRAGHAAAGMGSRTAHIEAGHRRAVIGMAQHRPRREQLVQVELAMEDVAADQAEGAFEVERAVDLHAQHRLLEVRRIFVDGI